ncbi:MAG TPA: 30S ribosomal protein S12 methylthiotransferase RimO, partial [Verrucomicrobiales bacterium]|nr:30S ribosomal protein S12 methylthiotransferase RimO [Verrucomicrobiales bacterium]
TFQGADLVIVNTCGFLDSAKQESLGAIGEAMAENGKVIVTGCMGAEPEQIEKAYPNVLSVTGPQQYESVLDAVHRALPPLHNPHLDLVPPQGVKLTPRHYAYLKISEGCNHSCSFCIIPRIRGRHRSRTQESVVKEARQLIERGVKEINLISQDTTYFGMDKWEGERPKPRSEVDSTKGHSLSTLIREINAIPGDFWIRLLYTHPAHWSDDLIAAIAESPKVARYIDMPLQHISDNMLTLMKRETDGAYIRNLIKRIRAGIPDIAIRTTFIVGFPGETDADFNELIQFIEDEKFERAGVFNYSREEDTRAAKMDGQIHHMTRKARWNEAMRAIQRSVEQVNRQQVGRTLRVLVEEPGVARSEMDAPDIDTTVFVDKKLPVGSFADVTVKDWRGYDLVAG